MKIRLLILPLLVLVACAEPEPEPTEVVQDAGDVAQDAGCGKSPGAICPGIACFTCENQHAPGCGSVCASHECWSCVHGSWQMTSVDCDPFCSIDAGTPAP